MRVNKVKFVTAMARAGINSRQLAELTGLNRTTISGIKNGRNCSPATAQKLVDVLGRQILEKHKHYYKK